MKKKLLSLLMLTIASLCAVPQAVVFDFSGVMTGDANRESVAQYLCDTLRLSPGDFEKANQERRIAVKGGATDEEFWSAYAKAKRIVIPENFPEKLNAAMKEATLINPKLHHLVNELKAREIPVAILSNADERLGKMVRSFNLYDPLSPCPLAFEIGAEKPDPKAFQILLARLGLPAAEIVYIDDLPENVAAAAEAGLDAILFESAEQIRGHLNCRGLLE